MIERRFRASEVRAETNNVISGYAARFGIRSHDLGGWKEKIAHGCFSRSLKSGDDVIMNVNHDPARLLGRTKNSTLQLEEDSVGLHFRCQLPPTQEGRDAYSLVKDGYLQDCSFAFVVDDGGDNWDEDDDVDPDNPDARRKIPIRTLRSVKLLDTAIVAQPAYPSTSVSPELDAYNPNPSLGTVGGRSLRDYFPQGVPAEIRAHLTSSVSVHLNFEDLNRELDELTRKPSLTRREEKRVDYLLHEGANLRRANGSELRQFDLKKLIDEAGRNVRRLPDAAEKEWRGFAKGEAIPAKLRPDEKEVRANLAGSQTIIWTQEAAGGSFVPSEFFDRLMSTGKQYDQLFDPDFSNQIVTKSGAVMPCPLLDDASTSGSVLTTEASAGVEADVANFGSVQLHAYTYRSGYVAVSLELLQDLPDEFPIGSILERVLSLRHAIGISKHFATGSGSSQPMGLVTGTVASGAVPTVASGSSGNTGGSETGSNSIGTADMNSVFKALNPFYRRNACWFMNPTSLDYLQGLVSKQGTEVVNFRKGFGKGDDMPFVLGRPVALCPSISAITNSANTVFFGDPSYFVTRLVRPSAYIQRFMESSQAIQYGLILFQSYLRADSNLLAPDTGALPFSYLQNHS